MGFPSRGDKSGSIHTELMDDYNLNGAVKVSDPQLGRRRAGKTTYTWDRGWTLHDQLFMLLKYRLNLSNISASRNI
jgi:hypothetical protein